MFVEFHEENVKYEKINIPHKAFKFDKIIKGINMFIILIPLITKNKKDLYLKLQLLNYTFS